jgi:uncharacterized protein YkwD
VPIRRLVLLLRSVEVLSLSALALAFAATSRVGVPTAAPDVASHDLIASRDPYTAFVAPSNLCPGDAVLPASTAQASRVMACLVNFARRKRGLPPLQLSPLLAQAGGLRLANEASCKELSHTACGEPFTNVFARAGYTTDSSSVGENLAWGQGDRGTPRAILESWLHSPGHRQNIFSSTWREMGLAFRRLPSFGGSEDVVLWANEFGARSEATG